jgi:hypothetical protein
MGRDNPERIKYFIKNAVEQWDVQYVMLVGGKTMTPVRYVDLHSAQGEFHYISDLYYADLYNDTGGFCSWDSNGNNLFGEANDTSIIDSMDLSPDVCLGRLLCSTEAEATVVVNKIIAYESTPIGSTSWFKNLVLCGGDEFPWTVIEFVFPLLLRHKGRMAFEDIYMSKLIASLLDDFTPKNIFTSLNRDAVLFTKKNIMDAIDAGAGFMVFSTHGTEASIQTHPPLSRNIWLPIGGFSSTDVDALQNHEKLPVAVFNACSCGDFDSSVSPLAWEFVKLVTGGSIASVACTTVGDGLPGTLCADSLLGYLTKEFFAQYADGGRIVGELWKASLSTYARDKEAMRIGAPNISIGDDLLY